MDQEPAGGGTGTKRTFGPIYPPAMMLELLVYCYITGTFSSRRIHEADGTDAAVRYICGGKAHPEFSVICAFRRENKQAFIKVLRIAQELGHLKRVGNISVDGTKIKADAGKHKAVSYEYAKKQLGVCCTCGFFAYLCKKSRSMGMLYSSSIRSL
ncbi:MAG: transposase [Treponema sp.]|jgi:transposase|nr:transposase [Treponema sp.]